MSSLDSSVQDLADGKVAVPITIGTVDDYFEQRTVATLPAPWSMVFLPDGDMLVTERPPAGSSVLNPVAEGHIRLVTQDGDVSAPLLGVPENVGVLDIVLSPDFAENHVVYFSFIERDPSAPREGRAAGNEAIDPAGIAVARAVLDVDNPAGPTLTSTSVIWHQLPKIVSDPGSGEPGGRLAFSPDGEYLYIASGDRQEFGPVQDLSNNLGKVIRLYPDGTVPADNPFDDVSGALPDIWTTGHRNPYGLTFDADGVLWQNEMGPKGGDELNVIRPGENYGWPNVSYGNNYDNSQIPDPSAHDGYAGSQLWWIPVIAPSGMISYSGDAFPDWKGDLIISGLQSKGLVIVDTDGTSATEELRINLGVRTRDVVQGPDGSLWVLYDQPDGRLVQLKPLDPVPGGGGQAPATTIAPTPLDPGDPTFTALSTGNFVRVWEQASDGQSALKAQLFSADGQKLGLEATLGVGDAGERGQASVAVLAGGGFAVVFGSRSAGDYATYLQLFNAQGAAIGRQVLLNTDEASFHSPPEVTVLSDGRLVATWLGTDSLDITGVRAQILTATGDKVGGEIVVSDHPESGKIGQSIVALVGGGFAVSWTDYGVETDAYGNGNTAVRAQLFKAPAKRSVAHSPSTLRRSAIRTRRR